MTCPSHRTPAPAPRALVCISSSPLSRPPAPQPVHGDTPVGALCPRSSSVSLGPAPGGLLILPPASAASVPAPRRVRTALANIRSEHVFIVHHVSTVRVQDTVTLLPLGSVFVVSVIASVESASSYPVRSGLSLLPAVAVCLVQDPSVPGSAARSGAWQALSTHLWNDRPSGECVFESPPPGGDERGARTREHGACRRRGPGVGAGGWAAASAGGSCQLGPHWPTDTGAQRSILPHDSTSKNGSRVREKEASGSWEAR